MSPRVNRKKQIMPVVTPADAKQWQRKRRMKSTGITVLVGLVSFLSGYLAAFAGR